MRCEFLTNVLLALLVGVATAWMTYEMGSVVYAVGKLAGAAEMKAALEHRSAKR